MAMNGLQIQKLLPKTNCKECGSNTCLAFAMRLAAKKANRKPGQTIYKVQKKPETNKENE